jgi:hypothetical protein
MPYPPTEGNPPRDFPQFDHYPYDYYCTGENTLQGKAPWLAGWLEYLMDTQYHGGHGAHPSDPENPDPKIQGFDFQDFFYPSDVLAGQDLQAIEDWGKALQVARFRNPDQRLKYICDNLNEDLEFALATWQGPTAAPVHDFRTAFVSFFPTFIDAITRLQQCLASYAAIIDRARTDLANLMSQCVQELHKIAFEDNDPNKARLAFLLGMGEWVNEKLPWGAGSEVVFKEVVHDALEKGKSSEFADLTGASYDEVLNKYLTAANKICTDARDGIEELTSKLRTLQDDVAPTPTLNAF